MSAENGLREPKKRAVTVFALLILVMATVSCRGGGATPTISGDVKTLFAQGNEYYERGDLEKAAAAFQAVLELQPDHVGALTNLGVVYYQLGRLEDAANQFEAGLEVNANDAELHYLLGAARLQQGRLDEAEKNFLRAKELKPELPEVWYGLGALYKLQGEKDKAIEAFEHFLEIGPGQDPRAMEEAKRELRELRGY